MFAGNIHYKVIVQKYQYKIFSVCTFISMIYHARQSLGSSCYVSATSLASFSHKDTNCVVSQCLKIVGPI